MAAYYSDIKYAEKQVEYQRERVKSLQFRVDKKQQQVGMWEIALKGIEEQKKKTECELDVLRYEHNRERLELTRMETHFKMLKNQHKSVPEKSVKNKGTINVSL